MSKTYSSTNTARRAAVSKAWANERNLVKEGKGTRDWTRSQQAEILATGKCKGYEGNHKFSVKQNPSLAGDEKNIQFLTRSEHLKAHNGNFKNDPKGRYNPDTGKVEKYADGKPKAEPVNNLTNKMSDSRKESAMKKYDTMQQQKAQKAKARAAERAKNTNRLNVNKETKGKQMSSEKRAAATRSETKTSHALTASRNGTGHDAGASRGTKTSQALRGSSKSSAGARAGKTSGGKSVSGGRSASAGHSGGKGSASGGHGGHGGSSGGHGGRGK